MSAENALILIVDDNKINLKVLGTILMQEGYEVAIAENGKDAIQEANTNTPNLILMDITMPVLDGFEATRQLKADKKTANIPVIFVTALNEESDETKGFKLGAVDYITKPVNRAIVLARVKTNLELNNRKLLLEKQVEKRTEELKLKNKELEETRLEIIQRLGKAAEFKDNETGNHILRMSKVSRIIAEGFGLNNTECDLILNASPMHDIGKIGIPDRVLLKPGKLDAKEWEIMQTHVNLGANILKGNNGILLKTAAEIALCHHEKWDGTGYPIGLKGEDIPLFARICAIADVFDALTSVRPYKDAWPVEKAVNLIKNEKGKHFQAELVDIFITRLPSIVEVSRSLSDG